MEWPFACIEECIGRGNGADGAAARSTAETAADGVAEFFVACRDARIALMLAGVLIVFALCPSLHWTKNLPVRCHTYLKPNLLAISLSDR